VAAGFVGVLVALQPGATTLSPQALVAVGGSLLYAISLAATRRLRGTPNIVLVASQVAALNLLSLTTLPFGWTMPGWRDATGLALIGVISLGGYLCVNRGLQLAPASVVAPFQYTSIVWASLLGYLVFGEVPGPALLVGCTIIVAAGIAVLLAERRPHLLAEG
jgi:drug/metabolite transporter (DMT)-like permease